MSDKDLYLNSVESPLDIVRKEFDGWMFEHLFHKRRKQGKETLLKESQERGIDWFARVVDTILTEKDPRYAALSQTQKNKHKNILNSVYSHLKVKFDGMVRSNGERVFEHLWKVALIMLCEQPNPSFKKVLICLFHDAKEDTDISDDTIIDLCVEYGKEVLKSVNSITKKDLRTYLDDEEKLKIGVDLSSFQSEESFEKYMKENGFDKILTNIKQRRTVDYFGHMWLLTQDELECKLADRLHNLRTEHTSSIDQIEKKFVETATYFLPVAKERAPYMYDLLIIELAKLFKIIQKRELVETLSNMIKDNDSLTDRLSRLVDSGSND